MTNYTSATPTSDANKTNRNLFWSGGSFLVTAILNFGTLYILTQLLSPSAMAIVFISVIIQDLALLFVDNGMSSFIVQSEDLTRREYSSLFYQVLLLASILTMVLGVLAPSLAIFFKSPPVSEALQITAFSFLCIALSFPQKGILQRHMHFKQIAAAEFTGMLLAAIVTLSLAYLGFGYKSYLYGFLIRKFAEAIVLWLKEPWVPRPLLLFQPFRALFLYSVYASNALLLSYSVRLVDTFIVGRMLGIHVLGLYSLASNIIFFPVSKCVLTFSRVFLVNFSLAKHENTQLQTVYADAMGKLYLMLLPALSVLAIIIPEIIEVFFKPAWLPVADLVRVMTIYGLFIAFLRIGESALLALAKVRTIFLIYTVAIILTGLLLILLIPNGAIGASWAVLLGAAPSCWMMARALNLLNIADWVLTFQRLKMGITLSLWLSFAVILIKFTSIPLIGKPAMLTIVALTTFFAYGWTYRQIKHSNLSKKIQA